MKYFKKKKSKNMNKKEAQAEIEKLKQNIENLQRIVDAKDIFSTTTYAAVCKELGEKELTINDFDFLHKDDRVLVFNKARACQLERYFNEGWIGDWSNTNERKWYCYYEWRNGRLVFFVSSVFYLYSYGGVAYFKTKEIANHIGNHFSDIITGCIKQK